MIRSDRLVVSGGSAQAAGELAADLARGIAGEVRFDAGSRAIYAHDGSNYRQVPIGVVMAIYFEEPVSSDDLDGLRLVRDRAPAGMAIAAGEYGYGGEYFRRMLEADAVDILQADATRALGITGFLQADALCAARSLPLSAHCAPAIHAHAGAAARQLVHLEHFRDHVRMEAVLFEGTLPVVGGTIAFDAARPGVGLVLRGGEAARHAG